VVHIVVDSDTFFDPTKYPLFKRVVACLSPQRPGFLSRLVYVEFVVGGAAVGQVPLRVVWFSFVTTIPLKFHGHVEFVYHLRYLFSATDSVVSQKVFLPPPLYNCSSNKRSLSV